MTQLETIQWLLSNGDWRCGTEFQAHFIPEYRSRINTLRKKLGLTIEARPCKSHGHASKTLQEWRWVAYSTPKSASPYALPPRNEERATPSLKDAVEANLQVSLF